MYIWFWGWTKLLCSLHISVWSERGSLLTSPRWFRANKYSTKGIALSEFPLNLVVINLEMKFTPFPIEQGKVRQGVVTSNAPKSTSSELSSFALHKFVKSYSCSTDRTLVFTILKWRSSNILIHTHAGKCTIFRRISVPWTWGIPWKWWHQQIDH